METRDILQDILDAEKEAAGIVSAAAERRNALAARIDGEKERLRLEYEKKTSGDIEKARRSERQRVDAELSRLDRETEEKLAGLRARFEASREEYCRRLLDEITGAADEE